MIIMIILKNVSTSNPGLARIPMSFASSAITDYIRNLNKEALHHIIMFIHLFIMIFLLCVCRDLTGKQPESILTKSKGKRAFTSFRFRNRSEAKSSGFQKI